MYDNNNKNYKLDKYIGKFTKDILKGVDNKQKTFLIISWLLYLFSIIFGIWTLMAITGTLSSARFQGPEKISIMTNIQLPAALQIITFVLGIINTIWYGASSVKKLTAQEK